MVYSSRSRVRALARAAFPRRHARLGPGPRRRRVREDVPHAELVNAVLIDLTPGTDNAWAAASLAREFPSAPFFGVTPLRSGDGPALSQCAALDFADVLIEGIDDGALAALVLPQTFRSRFAAALRDAPPALALESPLQRKTWDCVVAYAGLPVRTDAVATVVGVTREHLSRAFAAAKAPNLKRVIDLVRLVAAAGAGQEPRVRSPRRRGRPPVRIAIAPVQHHAAHCRAAPGIAGQTARGRSDRTLRAGSWPESFRRSPVPLTVCSRARPVRPSGLLHLPACDNFHKLDPAVAPMRAHGHGVGLPTLRSRPVP